VPTDSDKKALLTPLPGNKFLKPFHTCNNGNTYLEKAVTALGQVISGYPATYITSRRGRVN